MVAPVVEPAIKSGGLQAWADQTVASHVAAVSPDGTHVVESMMTLPGLSSVLTTRSDWLRNSLR